jgi:hypothetical protein
MEVDVKKFAAMFDKLPCVGKCELVTSTYGKKILLKVLSIERASANL